MRLRYHSIPPFSGWSPSGTYPSIDDSTKYYSPQFNPNNDNEIAFFDRDYGNELGIYKLNLLTNIKTPILIGVSMNAFFSWSKKDWIIFQKNTDFNIYKIKSNGDSITQLTFNGIFHGPRWNNDGTKFMATCSSDNIGNRVFDQNGNVIDTIPGWYGSGDWKHPQYIVGLPLDLNLSVMNVESGLVKSEINNENSNHFSVFGWATDNKIVYGDRTGLHTYWINNGIKQKMRNYCNAVSYISMTRNSTSTKLVFSKLEAKLVEIEGVEYEYQDAKLVIMNTDGSNEQEIIVP